MYRLLILVAATIAVAVITAPAWSQQIQPGQPTAVGGPGTIAPPGPADSLQPGGAAAARFNRIFGSPENPAGGINRVPWFNEAAVRQQLQLNQGQIDTLNNAYTSAWNEFQQGITGLDPALPPLERQQRIADLETRFNQGYSRTVDATITNPEVRQRFNQLRLQYQGQSTPSAPAPPERESLSAVQSQRLRLMAHQWNQQLAVIQQQAAASPETTRRRLAELQQEARDQISPVLTPEQQQIWPQLVDDYYNIAPDTFQFPTPPAPTQ